MNITSKGFKKELLLSSKEVLTLYTFMKEVIPTEIMIINTNIGLDVYYFSNHNREDFIFDTFLLLGGGNGKSNDHFFVKALNSDNDIHSNTKLFFEKLIKNPLLFKSYSKSLCHQLNANYNGHKKLIEQLLILWQQVWTCVNTNNKIIHVIAPFLGDFTGTSFEEAYKPLLRELINESLHETRIN